MPIELILALIAILLGSILQVGIGIGFSIIAGPLLLLQLGTEVGVPLLLLLNVTVSAVASPGTVTRLDRRIIAIAALGSIIGIGLGILIYPSLSEAMVLAIAGVMLVAGALVTFLPVTPSGQRALLPVSGLSGLATVWAATPGPLMALGLILANQPISRVRTLVQPIALIGYSVALLLHATTGLDHLWSNPNLILFLAITVFGSLLGRWIGPKLPVRLISGGIRTVSLIAGLILVNRAFNLS